MDPKLRKVVDLVIQASRDLKLQYDINEDAENEVLVNSHISVEIGEEGEIVAGVWYCIYPSNYDDPPDWDMSIVYIGDDHCKAAREIVKRSINDLIDLHFVELSMSEEGF